MTLFCAISCAKPKNVQWTLGERFPKDKIKIAVIHPNEIDPASCYDYAHYLGIEQMQKALDLDSSQIIRKTDVFEEDAAMTRIAIEDSIDEGANIVIAASGGYFPVCEELAKKYPHVLFALPTRYQENGTNLTSVAPKAYEGSYLSGVAAGMRTETRKIGFVAAMGKENAQVTAGLDAFAIGVERVNPHARVYLKVTHNWYDPMGESDAANALLAQGCDVIAMFCNTAHPLIAAEKAGKWGIGYNLDMSAEAPHAVITSVTLNWGKCYTRLVRSVIDGSFRPAPFSGGLAEGMVSLAPINEKLAAPGTRARVVAEIRRILSGEEGVFDGALCTNDGRVIGEAGKCLSDREILGDIHWYYRTIEVWK
jgi:basic membrane protein A